MAVGKACGVLALAGTLALPARAQITLLELDPRASEIHFTLGATLHRVQGSLRMVEGAIRLNRETGQATGRIVIDATSAETGNKKRDRDMHDKVLESQKYPQIIFEVSRVEGEALAKGAGKLAMHGTVTIHGERHPLSTPADVAVNTDLVEGRAVFRVPYVEWGMQDPSFLLLRVEKHVNVQVNVKGSSLHINTEP